MKDTICVAVGLVGGFFTAIFGGWDSALVTLVVFMAIDFFTGIITAMMKKSKHTESGGLSSKAGWFGLAKKVCTLMLIVVAVRMDILLNTNYIRDAVCISFCADRSLMPVFFLTHASHWPWGTSPASFASHRQRPTSIMFS